MSRALTIAATAVFFVLLQAMLTLKTELYEHEAIEVIFSQDLVVGLCLVLLMARLGARRWWAGLFAGLWVVLVVFDMVRSAGAVSMGQDPLIYDAVLLMAHLVDLLRNTLGLDTGWLTAGAAVGLLTLLGLSWGMLYLLMGRARETPWWALGLCLVLPVVWTGMSMHEESTRPSQLSTPALAENLGRSYRVWSSLQDGLNGDAYAAAAALKLDTKPDVHIYIIESYGRVMNRSKLRKAWQKRLGKMGRSFRDDGWFMATGLSEAPVSGGRSWLADATLFTGIQLKYESVYRHLVPQAGQVPSLVRLFEDNGYRTILVRPKDKARQGLELVNHFDFEETFFFEDLQFSGQPYGWSGIPDQFTLGKIRDEILPAETGRPNFVFFHMASSHIPWTKLPPVVEDWRDLEGAEEQLKPAKVVNRSKKKEVELQLGRYKRTEQVRVNRLRATSKNLERYGEAIDYDLEVLTQHLLELPEDPSLVILMGDHQPPMMGRSSDFSVPVHVLTRHPRLRREFIERGFIRGMNVQMSTPTVRHEGLFSVIARALAHNDQSEMPPYLPLGAVQGESQSEPIAR
jgi:hypothetical protein